MEVLVCILIAAAVIQFIYYLFFWYNWQKRITVNKDSSHPRVSVIICAKNEAENLRQNLPAVLEQNYPDFEVLVVDDGSADDTPKTLQQLKDQYSRLKSLYISPGEKTGSGKKYALQKGVQNASHDIILLTDADCRPASRDWIQKMVAALPDKQIVLGISPYTMEPGFLNALVEYETTLTAVQYIRYANAGRPYMGVGRNMGFQKELFLQKKWSDTEMLLPSGDDDLFIQTVANGNNTTVCTDPVSYTFSRAPRTWKDWYRQKKRHLATGFQYSFKHRVLLGTFLTSKLIIYLAFVVILLGGSYVPFSAGILLAYLVVITGVNYNLYYFSRLNHRWYLSGIFDPAYVFSIIFTGIAAKIAPQRTWK